MLNVAPLPHPGADGAADLLNPGDLLHRRHIVRTQLGKDSRPLLGRVAVHDVPLACVKRVCAAEDQRPRSLRPCCREHHGGRAAVAATDNGGASEADGVHDGLDLSRSVF